MIDTHSQTYLMKYGIPSTEGLLLEIHGKLLVEYPSVTYFDVRVYTGKLNEISSKEGLVMMGTDKVKELLLDLTRKDELEHKRVRIGITVGSYEHDVFGLPEED